MMKLCIPYFFIILLSTAKMLSAQDVHFSHIHASPISLNPSLTGLANGDYRLIVNYKNQWRSTSTNFNTMQISYDGRVAQFTKTSSLNLGLLILTDAAGDLNYRQTSLQVPMSVIMALDNNGMHNLALGMQHGLINYSADLSKIEAFDQEPLVGSLFSSNRFIYDFSMGYTWYSFFKEESSFYIGNSFYHINTPKVNTSQSNTNDNMYMKTVITAGGEFIVKGSKHAFLPSMISLFQGPHRETTIGTFYRFKSGKTRLTNNKAMLFGLWTRFYASPQYNSGFDALVSTVRLDYKKISYALSYDFTLSKYAIANKARGGIELSIIYIGDVKARKRGPSKITCPAW